MCVFVWERESVCGVGGTDVLLDLEGFVEALLGLLEPARGRDGQREVAQRRRHLQLRPEMNY